MVRVVAVSAMLAAGLSAQSFEVASIRPIDADAPVREPQIDQAMFVLSGTLFDFISSAYGVRPCARRALVGLRCNLIEGEPAWGTKDRFEIRAKLPAGSPAVARNQFADGEAPWLDSLLQSLLKERFQLRTHQETRELPAYLLAVKNPSKLKRSDGPILKQDADGSTYKVQGFYRLEPEKKGTMWVMNFKNITLQGLADYLTTISDRPVLDRSGVEGRFDLTVEFDTDSPGENSGMWRHMMENSLAIRAALEEQLGLRLTSAKAPIKVLVIDQAEKPSQN